MSYTEIISNYTEAAKDELFDLFVETHPVLKNMEEIRANPKKYFKILTNDGKAQSADSIDTVKKTQATIGVTEAGEDILKGTAKVNYTRLLLDELLFPKLQTVPGLQPPTFSYQASGEYSVIFETDPFYNEANEKLEDNLTSVFQNLCETIKNELSNSIFTKSGKRHLVIGYSLIEKYEHPENGSSGQIFKGQFKAYDDYGMVGRNLNITFNVASSRKPVVDERVEIGTEQPIELNAFG